MFNLYQNVTEIKWCHNENIHLILANSLHTGHCNSPSAGSSSQAIAHLPPSEGSNSTPAIAHLPSGEGGSSPQAGHSNNQSRSGRQGLRQSNRHRAPQASQENSTVSWEDNTTTTPPLGSPKGLLMKILTLSGSLIFPTNP